MAPITQTITRGPAEDLLGDIARAIAVRPGEPEARTHQRYDTAIRSVLSFDPRDVREIMLAGVIVGQFHMILGAIADTLRGQPDDLMLRMRSGTVALGRSFATLLKEYDAARARPGDGKTVEDATAQAVPKPAAAEQPAAPPPPPPEATVPSPDIPPDVAEDLETLKEAAMALLASETGELPPDLKERMRQMEIRQAAEAAAMDASTGRDTGPGLGTIPRDRGGNAANGVRVRPPQATAGGFIRMPAATPRPPS